MTENEIEYQTGAILPCFVTGTALTDILHSLKLHLTNSKPFFSGYTYNNRNVI